MDTTETKMRAVSEREIATARWESLRRAVASVGVVPDAEQARTVIAVATEYLAAVRTAELWERAAKIEGNVVHIF